MHLDFVGNLSQKLVQSRFGMFWEFPQGSQGVDDFALKIREFEHGEMGLVVATNQIRVACLAVFAFCGNIGLNGLGDIEVELPVIVWLDGEAL